MRTKEVEEYTKGLKVRYQVSSRNEKGKKRLRIFESS